MCWSTTFNSGTTAKQASFSVADACAASHKSLCKLQEHCTINALLQCPKTSVKANCCSCKWRNNQLHAVSTRDSSAFLVTELCGTALVRLKSVIPFTTGNVASGTVVSNINFCLSLSWRQLKIPFPLYSFETSFKLPLKAVWSLKLLVSWIHILTNGLKREKKKS